MNQRALINICLSTVLLILTHCYASFRIQVLCVPPPYTNTLQLSLYCYIPCMWCSSKAVIGRVCEVYPIFVSIQPANTM